MKIHSPRGEKKAIAMEKTFELSGKAALLAGVVLVVVIGVRLATFADSGDPELEEAVRAELWSTYSGMLGVEINQIREEKDYDSVGSLLERASPDAILIEKISRSEPVMSWASKQKVIVRVRFRFPEDTESRTEYMKFDHGMFGGWSYRYDTSAVAFYTNFF